MKKGKLLASMLIISLMVIIGLNNVFAYDLFQAQKEDGDPDDPQYHENAIEYLTCEVQERYSWKWENSTAREFYEGEEYTLVWGIRDKYVPDEYDENTMLLYNPVDIFDYELTFNNFSFSEGLERISVFDDESSQNGNQVYRIQVCAQDEKTPLGGTIVAKEKNVIEENWLDPEYNELNEEGAAYAYAWECLSCKFNTEAGNKEYDDLVLKLKIIEFKKGDVNRDHFVDFFDIIKLIQLVYDSPEGYEWDSRVIKAANMSATNLETPDFFTITNLIKYVYEG